MSPPVVKGSRSSDGRFACGALLLAVAEATSGQSIGRVVPPLDFTIEARWPGARADDVAKRVAAPIEHALTTMTGLRTMRSRSSEGRTIVEATFDVREAPDRTAARIERTLATIRPPLPEAVSRPTIAWSRDRVLSP